MEIGDIYICERVLQCYLITHTGRLENFHIYSKDDLTLELVRHWHGNMDHLPDGSIFYKNILKKPYKRLKFVLE